MATLKPADAKRLRRLVDTMHRAASLYTDAEARGLVSGEFSIRGHNRLPDAIRDFVGWQDRILDRSEATS